SVRRSFRGAIRRTSSPNSLLLSRLINPARATRQPKLWDGRVAVMLYRRQFLRYLAASPLIASLRAQQAKPDDGLSVMDFADIAHKAVPPAHWGYMASGVDDDLTLKANREGYKHFQLRARRLVDVSKPDLKTEIFGTTWDMPIFICPCGSQRAFHNDGELATA